MSAAVNNFARIAPIEAKMTERNAQEQNVMQTNSNINA